MKNLKKLSREELKNVNGGLMAPDAGGCGSSTFCTCGEFTINLGNGPQTSCCTCPRQGF